MAKLTRKNKQDANPEQAPVEAAELVQKTYEPEIDPLTILQGVQLGEIQDDPDELERELNPVQAASKPDGVIATPGLQLPKNKGVMASSLMDDDDVAVQVPVIRKVAIKKIDRFNFKMGLERLPEKLKLMPGVKHIWQCAKKGNEYLTGLEEHPEVRKRLEKELRVDLSPTSPFWASLTFDLQDKEHGQILNFDDSVMGAHYEVVYYAMMASPIIANGLQEYTSGRKPEAEWYIENKEAEAEALAAEVTAEKNALRILDTISEQKALDFGKLIGLPVWGLTPRAAALELWKAAREGVGDTKAQQVCQNIVVLGKYDATQFAVAVTVKTAIKLNVIRRNRTNDYVFANEVLGPTEEHVVKRLAQPDNALVRQSIEAQTAQKARG